MAKIGTPSFQDWLFDSFWTLLYTIASLSLCLYTFRYLGEHFVPVTSDTPKVSLLFERPSVITNS
jgi:hypothetical protein